MRSNRIDHNPGRTSDVVEDPVQTAARAQRSGANKVHIGVEASNVLQAAQRYQQLYCC